MNRMVLVWLALIASSVAALAQNPSSVTLLFPNGGETFRPGSTQELRWDTTGTFRARWRFLYGTTPGGPWTALTGPSNVLDSGTSRGQSVPTTGGWRVPAQGTSTGYLRVELISDPSVYDITDNPFTIETPGTVTPDSIIKGDINGTVHLHANKIYGIEGYVYVNDGGKLVVDPGTIVVGDVPGTNSAIIVNRGGKIIADGTRQRPIIFTSRAAAGQRSRGDWGGILICGKGRTNAPAGQSSLEGGVAESTVGGKGWYGGTDDEDSSGVLRYVRIEFAGIATQPNSELNGLTMGCVGSRTVLDYIQVSYGNDDAFEWFGGAVNAKHLVAYGTLDDDFDTDNGFSGKIQFGLVKRFRTTADVSTSQAFESDNDATGSANKPYTYSIFSNITVIGPVQDTSWATGSGANQFSPRYGAAAQIRRSSHQSIVNSVFVGWPRGLEIAQASTMAAAFSDSMLIRNNNWYGVKNATLTLAGGTAPVGMDVNWLTTAAFGNVIDKSNPNNAFLSNIWVNDNTFDPRPASSATYLGTASFTGNANVNLQHPFFEKVAYRGAFPTTGERWDDIWTEYDPVNADYRATPNVHILTPGSTAGEKYTHGQKVDITWGVDNAAGSRFKFEFGTSVNGPWTTIAGAADVTDAGATRGKLTGGFTVPTVTTTTGYIRMSLVGNPALFDITDVPFEVGAPVSTEPVVKLIEPGTSNKTFRVGQSVDLRWDTTNTYRQKFRFEFGKSATGPWKALAGAGSILDSATRGVSAAKVVFRPEDVTTTGYIRMTLLSDTTKTDINDAPFTVTAPAPVTPDSIIKGEINGRVRLVNTKIYGIEGYVYVNDGATLDIQEGTVIVGDLPGTNSAIIVNRGGKLVAQGKANDPIIFTSRAVPGQRRAGDWGGILICGKAKTNRPGGQTALEGGVASTEAGGKGWYGGDQDEDSSGVLSYVRIEFAGIATLPNSELNGLTMGSVGSKTVLDHIQVSYGNDDAFEWFGGTVNAKYLVATGTLDDDFDTDNGYRGKVQFAVAQRFRTTADASTSQHFESDNDAEASYNQPFTSAIFSNVTGIGPLADTSWTTGSGANQYSPRFGAAVQIRRNSRLSIHNSVFLGWPRGLEIAQVPTMIAALGDSVVVRNNSWYGVKNATLTLAGGTAPAGLDNTWLAKAAFGNIVDKSSPDVAMLMNPFTTASVEFNPAAKAGSPVLTGAHFEGNAADAFFERVDYRGAFGMNRWDAGWTEYDPINKEYLPHGNDTTSVQETGVTPTVVAKVYPNPTTDVATVRYELNTASRVTIRMVDITGSFSSTMMEHQNQEPGVYMFNINASGLSTGVYYVTIESDNGYCTIPVTVAK